MSKNSKLNTAHFLISKFSNTSLFLNLQLCGNTQSVLRHLGDLMDANLKKNNIRQCSIKRPLLAARAGIGERRITKHIEILIKYKLIEIVKKLPNNIPVYQLGLMFEVYEKFPNLWDQLHSQLGQNVLSSWDNLSASWDELSYHLGRNVPTHIYNTAYKTNHNGFAHANCEKQDQMQKQIGQLTNKLTIN